MKWKRKNYRAKQFHRNKSMREKWLIYQQRLSKDIDKKQYSYNKNVMGIDKDQDNYKNSY